MFSYHGVMPQHKELHSENADYQLLLALRDNRTKRHKQRLFFVEGVRPVTQALTYGWRFRKLVFAKERPLSHWAQDVLAEARADVHYLLPHALQAKLSTKNEPSELIAILEMPEDAFERIVFKTLPLVVVADRSSNPGNLGTIIRSCDALGVDGLVMTGHAVDLYDPEVIAASTGSFFALPVIRKASARELAPLLERLRSAYGDVQLVGTSAQGTRPLREGNFWRPTVLFVGNETDGLSQAYAQMADVMVTIPMQGSASSLNVACATSIVLYEIARQRTP